MVAGGAVGCSPRAIFVRGAVMEISGDLAPVLRCVGAEGLRFVRRSGGGCGSSVGKGFIGSAGGVAGFGDGVWV